MNKLVMLLMVGLFPILSQAKVNCDAHPIYCDILKLKPSVDREFARQLSDSIHRYSSIFGTDPKVSVAIAMQESSFSNIDRMGTVLTKQGKFVKGATDLGVFQIHINTISNLKNEGHDVDVERLKVDVDYQAYWHTKILKSKILTCRIKRRSLNVAPGEEWSCYHSFTPAKRSVYVRDVGNHLSKIKT